MTSNRPYLLRAIYDWILDNNLTPHLLVDTKDARVAVPRQYVKDDSIVLNVAPSAVRNLRLGNDAVSFSARFGGTPFDVYVPLESARMIFAKENGQGIALPDDPPGTAKAEPAPEPPKPAGPAGKPRAPGSHLKRIK